MSPIIHRLVAWVFPTEVRRSTASTIGRALLVLVITVYSIPYFSIDVRTLGHEPGWMHHVHLVFHEAGHAITGMLTANRDAVVLMGSGFQVLFPLFVAACFYWKNSDSAGAAFALWWTGSATLDTAPYIGDARALELELLTGGTGREVEGHDWEYLLTRWDLLQYDTAIAHQVATAGRVLMVISLLWAAASIIYDRFICSDEEQQ